MGHGVGFSTTWEAKTTTVKQFGRGCKRGYNGYAGMPTFWPQEQKWKTPVAKYPISPNVQR